LPGAASTVIGVPDDYRGEAPKAFVQLRADAGTDSERRRENAAGDAAHERNEHRERLE